MGQVDLTPSPDAYLRMLTIIAIYSHNEDDVAWAEAELTKLVRGE